jgi:hypothetical protein
LCIAIKILILLLFLFFVLVVYATLGFTLTWAGYPLNDATKSPCIDTGDPTSSLDTNGTRADMGAIAYEQIGQSTSPAGSAAIHLLLLN